MRRDGTLTVLNDRPMTEVFSNLKAFTTGGLFDRSGKPALNHPADVKALEHTQPEMMWGLFDYGAQHLPDMSPRWGRRWVWLCSCTPSGVSTGRP